jgi:hypothetical protein
MAQSAAPVAQFSVQSSEELHEIVHSGRVSMEFRPFHDPLFRTFPVSAQCSGPEAFFPLTDQLYAERQAG